VQRVLTEHNIQPGDERVKQGRKPPGSGGSKSLTTPEQTVRLLSGLLAKPFEVEAMRRASVEARLIASNQI
jgi:hypothetical protein